MSGIAALVRLDGRPADPSDAARMTRALAHRGPDGSGVWSEGAVALGHRMLRSTPESVAEILPRRHPGGALAITTDARLDNGAEILGAIGAVDWLPARPGDADLILAAYERWGAACPQRLLGDFAFVVWDGKRRLLFGARDPFGVRPLYYHESAREIAVASEARAILTLPGRRFTIDEGRIADYLVPCLEGVDLTSTFHLEIRRLPPGHAFLAGPEGLRLTRYFDLDPCREIRLGGDEEYAEAFRAEIEEAVRRRLRSGRPTACMVSGGVDSTAIAAVARHLSRGGGGGPLRTVSAVSDDEGCRETRAIRSFLRLPGLDATIVRPSEIGPFVEELRRLHGDAGEPFDVHMVLPRLLYAVARRQGVNVILDGVDGDAVASHEPTCLPALVRRGHLVAASRQAVAFARFYRGIHEPWGSAWRLGLRSVRSALMPARARRAWLALRGGAAVDRVVAETILSPSFARRVRLAGRLDALRSQGGDRPARSPREHQARGLAHPYVAVALERYDRVAAACSVEPRHPFFDRRLVEFCLALPFEQKVARGFSKLIVRRAMAGLVPDEVRWRRGRWEHLGASFARAFLEFETESLEEASNGGLKDIDAYVDARAVRSAHERFRRLGSLDDLERVWQAATLASWLRRQSAVAEPMAKVG